MNKDFCFCTLALGERYRVLAKELAKDIAKYSPRTKFVILTDRPEEFKDCTNVIAFMHRQRGIFACFNDKRFVIEKALSEFEIAVNLDADTRLSGAIPENMEWVSGIAGCGEDLIKHVSKYRPERIEWLGRIASKIDVRLENAEWIGESLWVVSRDDGKEREFIRQWGIITGYLELHGIHDGEGAVMGLAAAKIGWTLKNQGYDILSGLTKHMDASDQRKPGAFLEGLKRRLGYHCRLNKARLLALRDFDFYYK